MTGRHSERADVQTYLNALAEVQHASEWFDAEGYQRWAIALHQAYRTLDSLAAALQAAEEALRSANLVSVECPECGSDENTYWRGGKSPNWECPCAGVIFNPLEASGLPAQEDG